MVGSADFPASNPAGLLIAAVMQFCTTLVVADRAGQDLAGGPGPRQFAVLQGDRGSALLVELVDLVLGALVVLMVGTLTSKIPPTVLAQDGRRRLASEGSGDTSRFRGSRG